ncbi:hypothetical protein Q7W37_09180 [Streptococcus suis]|nr:hypothetical protein [Streptococcus suis]
MSIRTYLSEVHGTFLQTLINLMNDYSAVDDLNLRIPDGNEFGANELWQPGGRTYPGYTLKAVTDVIPNELTTVTRLE